jgi:hypothetical protein
MVEALECRSQLSVGMAIEHLKQNPMMNHLFTALERGEDIGHYGRLVVAMIGRHFLSQDELCTWLQKNPGVTEADASALCRQVEQRDYNPPRRERIMEWDQQQAFPICPDPNGCNVYRDLQFPEHVYEHIQEFYRNQS